MRVAVSGASGLIGSALCPLLEANGHSVLRLVRRPTTSPSEITWNPKSGDLDEKRFASVEAVINLAGAGVGDHRWTEAYKAEIRDSRVLGTRTLAGALAVNDQAQVFVGGSAIGYYGDRGATELTETSSKGSGFLSDVVADWERAADPAREVGIRVAHLRTGLVADAGGGAWQRMLRLFRLGLGGKLGSGDQYWSYISLRDVVRAIDTVLTNDALTGPVNLTAPNPVTNADVTRALGRALGRPTFASVPGFAIKMALGEFSTEVLSSARVLPAVLESHGFRWLDPTIDAVTEQVIAQ